MKIINQTKWLELSDKEKNWDIKFIDTGDVARLVTNKFKKGFRGLGKFSTIINGEPFQIYIKRIKGI